MELDKLTTREKAQLRYQESQAAFKSAKLWGTPFCGTEEADLLSLSYPGEKAVVLDIHGGGFCFKSVLDNDVYCHYLSEHFHYAVLNAAFTLSFQSPFPRAIEDILADLASFYRKWPVYATLPLILVGHSSGANLAAAVALKLPHKVSACVLNYPFLDLARSPASRPEMSETFPDWLLEDWITLYCPDARLRTSPAVSPLLLTPSEAKEFPPSYISIATHDRLQEDGRSFAALLAQAGVPHHLAVVVERHGFIERHMRDVYEHPEQSEVQNAIKVSNASFRWVNAQLAQAK